MASELGVLSGSHFPVQDTSPPVVYKCALLSAVETKGSSGGGAPDHRHQCRPARCGQVTEMNADTRKCCPGKQSFPSQEGGGVFTGKEGSPLGTPALGVLEYT